MPAQWYGKYRDNCVNNCLTVTDNNDCSCNYDECVNVFSSCVVAVNCEYVSVNMLNYNLKSV